MDPLTWLLDLFTKWHEFLAALLSALFAVWSWFSRRSSRRSADRARESAAIAQRSLHTTANQFAAQLVIQAGRMFIERPELKPYFDAKGKLEDAPTNEERQRVEAVATTQLDVMETIWDHYAEYDEDDREAWCEWMHDMFENSVVLQDAYVRAEGWYPSLKEMLAERACTRKLGPHPWALERKHEYATAQQTELGDLRGKLQSNLPAADQLELIEQLAMAQSRSDPGRAAVLAGSYIRHARENDRSGVIGALGHWASSLIHGMWVVWDRIRASGSRLLWGPTKPLPPELTAIVEDETYSRQVDEGRSKSLRSASEYARDEKEPKAP